ncbi:MAG: hypothetical protein ACOYK9_00555 [Chlamydiia bacterium]
MRLKTSFAILFLIASIVKVEATGAPVWIAGGGVVYSGPVYATFLDAEGNLIPITGISPNEASITAVAMNNFGNAIIGGGTPTGGYAAVVSPSGVATVIGGYSLNDDGRIAATAIN